jgi:hypothetical protein
LLHEAEEQLVTILVVKKLLGSRICESGVIRIINDPSVTPERAQGAAQTRTDPGAQYIERGTIHNDLSISPKLFTPARPERIFRVAAGDHESRPPRS